MKKFKLHQVNGKTEKVEGVDGADAMKRAGIGVVVSRPWTALDHWEEIVADDELNQLTMDEIINAMRMKGVRKIEIYTTKSGKKSSDPFVAEVVEWNRDTTFLTEDGEKT